MILFYAAMIAFPRFLTFERHRQLFFRDANSPPLQFSLRTLIIAITLIAAMIVLFMKLGRGE